MTMHADAMNTSLQDSTAQQDVDVQRVVFCTEYREHADVLDSKVG
jgi:hypothetical protein